MILKVFLWYDYQYHGFTVILLYWNTIIITANTVIIVQFIAENVATSIKLLYCLFTISVLM